MQFEIAKIPDAQRRARAGEVLDLAGEAIELVEEIEAQAGCNMSTTIRPLTEITEQATRILIREMGVVDVLRFLSQFRAGAGDYTKERGQWLDELSLEDIASGIKAKRRKPRRANS
jgi:hypothetical protein